MSTVLSCTPDPKCSHFVRLQTDNASGPQSQVIARVPGLTLLNGSMVDALERRDSELHYLRGLLAQAEEQPAQLLVQSPCSTSLSGIKSCKCCARDRPLTAPGSRVMCSTECTRNCPASPMEREHCTLMQVCCFRVQALEAAHPRLAPLREKYGLMTGLARSQGSQGGTAPMASSMMTLHLAAGGNDQAAAKYSMSIPGGVPLSHTR